MRLAEAIEAAQAARRQCVDWRRQHRARGMAACPAALQTLAQALESAAAPATAAYARGLADAAALARPDHESARALLDRALALCEDAAGVSEQ